MSKETDHKMTRSQRRQMAKRKQQMQSIGMMILGILIIVGVVAIITIVKPGASTASGRDYSQQDMNTLGDPNAPVVIEIYSNFGCIHCDDFSQQAEGDIIANYVNTGKVRLVYRAFNNNPDDQYGLAAQAAYCAGEQNKFWEMHDIIFANFNNAGYTEGQLANFADSIGLNVADFSSCLTSRKYSATVSEDFQAGIDLGISGTPSFSVNGVFALEGNQPYAMFVNEIEKALTQSN